MTSFSIVDDRDSHLPLPARPDPGASSSISRSAQANPPNYQRQLSSDQSYRIVSPDSQLSELSLQDGRSANSGEAGPSRPSVLPTGSSTVASNRRAAVSSSWGVPSASRPVAPTLSTEPYRIHDEKPPEHAFFTGAFQTALKGGLYIAKGIASTIRDMPDSVERSPEVRALLHEAESLTKFVRSDTRTVAVLGDSGEGKSSLINSLLHVPEIAKTGDIGSSCTSVITEYRQKTGDHTAPIIIEVEYLSRAEIEDSIKELVWNYRQLFLPRTQPDETQPDETPAADDARSVRESEQAWCALEAAFKHERRFSKEMLEDMSDGALERIQDQLISWTNDMTWPDGSSSGFWTSSANTPEECSGKTSVFMQDRYWPFTKTIRIYLDAQVLQTGLILADLPGLQDTNLARVRATEKYLMKCDNILIVANIARAITDQSLKSSLFKVLSRHIPLAWEESAGQGLNVGVVCTKSENINLRAARREFCGPNRRISQETMDQYDRYIEAANQSNNTARKKELKRRQEWLLIKARNDYVTEGLQNAYAAKVPREKLDVFCVSNTTYEKYSEKGNRQLVHASGIPQLRRFCHSITAEAQFREALHFLRSTLSSLVNSLELWTNTNLATQRREENTLHQRVYAVLSDVSNKLHSEVSAVSDEFKDYLEEQILEFIENRSSAWEEAAAAEGQRWLDWRWMQYRAWCLRNGHHQTPCRPREDWNAKILWNMRTELAPQWDLVEDEVSPVFEILLDTVKDNLKYLKDEVEDSTSADISPALVQGIDSRIQGLKYTIRLEKQRFANSIRLVRRNASETNFNSYILEEMIPAYRTAASQRGLGTDRRQKQIVQGRITDGTLFPNMSLAISENIDSAIIDTERRLRSILTQSITGIQNDFDLVHPPNADRRRHSAGRGEERDRQMRERQALADQARSFKERYTCLLESIADMV